MDVNLSDVARVRTYGKIIFRCRLQKSANTFYSQHWMHFSKACRRALTRFAQALKGGTLRIEERSRFLTRRDLSDKVTRSVILTQDIKDWMEKISYSERISQNEVLRMALEWWMEAANPLASGRSFRAACRKWYHDRIISRPEEFFFHFWQYARIKYDQYPLEEETLSAIRANFPSRDSPHTIERGKLLY